MKLDYRTAENFETIVRPDIRQIGSSIVRPGVQANNFEL